jgi:hypothetical protein
MTRKAVHVELAAAVQCHPASICALIRVRVTDDRTRGRRAGKGDGRTVGIPPDVAAIVLETGNGIVG